MKTIPKDIKRKVEFEMYNCNIFCNGKCCSKCLNLNKFKLKEDAKILYREK